MVKEWNLKETSNVNVKSKSFVIRFPFCEMKNWSDSHKDVEMTWKGNSIETLKKRKQNSNQNVFTMTVGGSCSSDSLLLKQLYT